MEIKKNIRILSVLSLMFAVFSSVSCMKDIPSMDIPQEVYYVDSTGGELVIPFYSTSFSDAYVDYFGKWETDSNGDFTMADPWIEIVKVGKDNPNTKDLAIYHSAVYLSIEPNDTGSVREATVTLWSYSKSDRVRIIQTSKNK